MTFDFIAIDVFKTEKYFTEYMNQHPNVNMWSDNITNIRSVPILSSKSKLNGAISSEYMFNQKYVNDLYYYNPDIKLIFILREPIVRVCLEWSNLVTRNSQKKNDLITNLDYELNDKGPIKFKTNMLSKSCYIEHINRFLKKFSKKNIIIVSKEQILENPSRIFNSIFEFLKLNRITISNKTIKFENDLVNILPKVREISETHFKKKLITFFNPYNLKLYNFIGTEIRSWEKFYKRMRIINNLVNVNNFNLYYYNITRRKQARISIQVDDEPDVKKMYQQCIKNIGLDLIKNDYTLKNDNFSLTIKNETQNNKSNPTGILKLSLRNGKSVEYSINTSINTKEKRR